MPEILKPTPGDQTPFSDDYILDSVIVLGRRDHKSKDVRLDAQTSSEILASAVALQTNITRGVILGAETPEEADLMVDRLNDSIKIDNDTDESPVSVITGKRDSSSAQLVRNVKKRFPDLNRLGIIMSNSTRKQNELRDAGIILDEVSLDDVLNRQMAEKTANSPSSSIDMLLEIGKHFMQYKTMFMGGFSLYRVAEKSRSSA